MMDKNGVICEDDGHVIDLSGKAMTQKTLDEIKAEQEALFQRLMGIYSKEKAETKLSKSYLLDQ